MKSFIKKILRENLINERLMNFGDDVDLIYDKFFKKDYEQIKKTESLKHYNPRKYDKSFGITTEILQSDLSKKAHKINPCSIIINVSDNHYNPHNSIISLGPNKNAIDFILNNGVDGEISSVFKYLSTREINNIKREFKPEIIKGSIHHELSHWVDDTLHNRHIKSKLKPNVTVKDLGVDNINAHYLEIQAIIHNVVQLKRENEDIWDLLSFSELINMSPSLNSVYNTLKGETKIGWIKNLKRRMYREGLLGKEMANG